jgi:hypothetical protein
MVWQELGEHLDAGQAGLVVVGVSDMGAKIEREMKKARSTCTARGLCGAPGGRTLNQRIKSPLLCH